MMKSWGRSTSAHVESLKDDPACAGIDGNGLSRLRPTQPSAGLQTGALRPLIQQPWVGWNCQIRHYGVSEAVAQKRICLHIVATSSLTAIGG